MAISKVDRSYQPRLEKRYWFYRWNSHVGLHARLFFGINIEPYQDAFQQVIEQLVNDQQKHYTILVR